MLPALQNLTGRSKQALNIVERPVSKNRLDVPTVSFSAFAYLFSELISYTIKRADNVTELEDRLDKVGYEVGFRMLELLSYKDKQLKRKLDVLDVLRFIHNVAWPYMFGKTADELQKADSADDEYMISDYDLLISRHISVPKNYGSFTPGALAAGMVRGILDGAGFPAKVLAHYVEAKDRSKPATIIQVKFDQSVMQRQAFLDNLNKG